MAAPPCPANSQGWSVSGAPLALRSSVDVVGHASAADDAEPEVDAFDDFKRRRSGEGLAVADGEADRATLLEPGVAMEFVVARDGRTRRRADDSAAGDGATGFSPL